MRSETKKTVIGYCRVSTTKQAVEGVSLDAQRQKIIAWAAMNDMEMGGIHVDAGISGARSDTRPALEDALHDVCACGGVLVVYSLSRLSRSTRDAIDISSRLEKSGADLVSLSESIDTTSASGKMIFRLMAVLAEFERDQISERVSCAMRHKRELGEYTGGSAPFGMVARDGKLLENAEEKAAAKEISRLRGEGKSLRDISKALQSAGVLSRVGTPISPKQIRAILMRNKQGGCQ